MWSIKADVKNAQLHSGPGREHDLKPNLECLNTLSVDSSWKDVPFWHGWRVRTTYVIIYISSLQPSALPRCRLSVGNLTENVRGACPIVVVRALHVNCSNSLYTVLCQSVILLKLAQYTIKASAACCYGMRTSSSQYGPTVYARSLTLMNDN